MSSQRKPKPPFKSFSSLGFRLFVDTLTHPLEYSKFLIQIGHEPLPPYPTRTLYGFGQPAIGLPNCIEYIRYIQSVDGWTGCYRGCAPKLIGRAIGSAAATSAVSYLQLDRNDDLSEDMELTDEEELSILRSNLIKDVVGRTVLVVVSHPFLVISNRMMAQFVGGEDTYRGIVSSAVEIFRQNGPLGFFAGIFPRWLGELVYVGFSSIVVYGVNNFAITDREMRSFTTPVVQFIASSVVFQFSVVSSCMSVNNCGLLAGVPPNMPIYKSWWSCRQHLSSIGQLGRGSSPFFRTYVGPPAGTKPLASY